MTTGNAALDRQVQTLYNQISALSGKISQLERNQRAAQLGSASIDGGSLTINDGDGNPQVTIGQQGDGTYGVTYQTGAPAGPPTPDDPQVQPASLGLVVAWDGLIGGGPPPANFGGMQVHCSTVTNFTPSAATLQGTMPGAGLFSIPNLVPGQTYYVCLVTTDTAGNTGTESDFIAGVAGQLNGSFIAPNSVNAADVLQPGSVIASNLYVSYVANVLNHTPTIFYKLDDGPGSTTAADDSGNSHTATVIGSVTFGVQNIGADAAPSASFDGSTTAISSSYVPPALSALTVEFLINVNGQTQTNSFPAVVSSSPTSGSNKGFQVYYYQPLGQIAINLGNGTTWFTGIASGASAIPASGWTHVAFTYDGTTTTLYINGVAQGTATAMSGPIAADTHGVSIGDDPTGGTNYKGLLSMVAVYPTALTAQQVQADYFGRSGAIIADNIAADAISANHILAGTIVAGIVNGTLIEGATIIADGTSGQFFIFNSTPGLNNMAESHSAIAGVDGFGNHYLAGTSYYTGNTAINIVGVTLQWLTGSLTSGWGSVLCFIQNSPGTTILQVIGSPVVIGTQVVVSNSSSATAHTTALLEVQGLAAIQNGAVALVSNAEETWHTPSYNTNWAGGPRSGTVQACQYRMCIDGTVEITGSFSTSTSQVASATCIILPTSSIYVPATPQRIPCVFNIGGTVTASYLQISGTLITIGTAMSGAGDVYVSAHYRVV